LSCGKNKENRSQERGLCCRNRSEYFKQGTKSVRELKKEKREEGSRKCEKKGALQEEREDD